MSNILKYQNPSSPLLIQQVNQSGANFVKRLLDPNRKSIPDWETKGAKIATHKLGWAEDDHGAYVFPEVQEIDGQLIDFSRPPYASGIADYMAHKNNNIIRMSPEEADWFTRNYKQYYPSFKKGGRIHIKKKNRGSFTRWCNGKVTEECIRRGKNSSNPAIRKKAVFAANARRWKHENGGVLKYQDPVTTLNLPEGSVYGGELEPVIIKPAPIKAELNTYYPIVSKYPWTGHSELILHYAGPQKSSVVITKGGYNSDYNLITNNCSDSTRCAVEQIYNEKINPILFTTPGDVRDFLLKKGIDKIKTGNGVESQYFEIPFATAMELRNKNIDYQIQDYLKKAEDHKKDMEKLAKSHDRKWNSSGYDESTAKVIEELERRKYKFQPFKNNNGGILKVQEGTTEGFWSKLWNAVKEGGMAARDAKLGAVGAQQVRDLYSEGKNQDAQDLAKQYAKANTTGIALAGGAVSTGLLGDLMVTGATTAADTFIDGDTENFGTNLLTNVSADLLGNGVGKIVNFKNFLKNNSDLQKWLFGKGSLKNKFSDGKFIYNEFVNPDWRKYELANKMILSKINRDWGLQYLEPEDYLKKVGNSKGNTNPNTKTVYIKKAKFPWANQHTVGHEINHVIQQGYIPSSWNNIILNNQSFGRVPKKSIYPTVRYGEYTTVDPNYADTFPSLNDIRLRSENAPDPKQILWYSSPDEIDSEFAGGLFEGYNPKESIENIQQKWNLAGFSIDDYEIENIDKLFREIDVNNKQRILLNGKRKNPILNSTKSYLHAVNESSDDIDNIVKNINSGIKIGTGASIGTSIGLYNLLNDNE